MLSISKTSMKRSFKKARIKVLRFLYPVNDNFELLITYLTLAVGGLYLAYLLIWSVIFHDQVVKGYATTIHASSGADEIVMAVGNPVYDLPASKGVHHGK